MNATPKTPWADYLFESMLIVVSILIAFSIDAWWEGRQETHQRMQLVSALELDFETTRSRLAKSISIAEGLDERATGFLSAVGSTRPVELDSLRYLIGGAFSKIDFEPALSAYEGAISTGKIRLLNSPGLLEAFAEFNQASDYYEMHDRITADIFYLGPIWELRRELGSLRLLFREPDYHPERFRQTDDEYRQFFSRPIVYAAIEVMLTAQRNSTNGLRRMDVAAGRVLEELEKLP